MANRYDRDSDDQGFWRRERRDEDDRARSPYEAQGGRRGGEGRHGEGRGERLPWREGGGAGSREDDWRSASGREGPWRDNDYFSSRDRERGYYSSPQDHGERGPHDRGYGDRSHGDRSYGNWGGAGGRSFDREGRSLHSHEREPRGSYRGLYQEQGWARDPRSGDLYGYEYSTRLDPRRFNAGDESSDRWRSEDRWRYEPGRADTRDQNRRFDIDRGWHTPGTSGYGNVVRGGQGHYGKGPKGYTRSDERIREDVCDRLSDDDELDASDITVVVKGGEVTLDGTVSDRRSKHRAEDIAESVSGVRDVVNHLRARKGLLREIGDRITGDEQEHQGHRGSGTRNTPAQSHPH